MEQELIGIKQVIDLLECSRSTVYNLIRSGKLKPYGKYLSKVVFLRQDVINIKSTLIERA